LRENALGRVHGTPKGGQGDEGAFKSEMDERVEGLSERVFKKKYDACPSEKDK
jgi:hypothetical protein